ncbi:hypothetical protein FCOIX_9085 [Fusarium coicis]|nr:hypothetical protein FCOIX_9085 [Fusarium coicis]
MADRHRDNCEAGAALLPPKFESGVWIYSRSPVQLSDYSQQSYGRRIDIRRKLDHDYDYDRDSDRDEGRQDAGAPTSEANIFVPATEAYRDEAITSPPTYTELPSTMKVTPLPQHEPFLI